MAPPTHIFLGLGRPVDFVLSGKTFLHFLTADWSPTKLSMDIDSLLSLKPSCVYGQKFCTDLAQIKSYCP